MNLSIDINQLKDQLCYDPNTGIFIWLISKGRCKNGDIAGSVNSTNKYTYISIDNKKYLAHRLAWLYMNGEWSNNEIDHINHIRSDNRYINLRSVSSIENSRNRSMDKRNTSGYNGVHWNKHRNNWLVNIRIEGKTKYIGSFLEIGDAIIARARAEELYNFHPNHGKIGE